MSTDVKFYCVSCAVHRGIVKVRSEADRRTATKLSVEDNLLTVTTTSEPNVIPATMETIIIAHCIASLIGIIPIIAMISSRSARFAYSYAFELAPKGFCPRSCIAYKKGHSQGD